MKEKPILFSTPMVKAILEGRKTMTRRIPRNYDKILTWYEDAQNIGIPAGGQVQFIEDIFRNKRPYSEGDVLWVRETWARISDWAEVDPSVGAFDGYIYKADWGMAEHPKWCPSIFMPREAARIFLRVTGVRVERIQETSEADAMSEGVQIGRDTPGCGNACINYKTEFSCLWNTLNAKRGYSWESNPWVWVIEFKRIEK